MSNNHVRFQLVEATFQNYEHTKQKYPLIPSVDFERIIGVVKTVDTSAVYVDLESAMKQIRQIVPSEQTIEDDAMQDDALTFASDSMLARMGAVMLLCSLIENRLRAMYRQRMAVINGTQPLTAAEEAEIYEVIQNDPQQKYKLKRDVTEALRICRFLLWSHDVDVHTFHLLEQFTKVRNALVHDAMFRSAHFSDGVLGFLRRLYSHMQNMRNKMTRRLASERALYADDGLYAQRIALQLDGVVRGASLSRLEVYQRLAGSIRFDMPMVNRRFCYVVAPVQAIGAEGMVMLENPVKLLDDWQGVIGEHTMPVPLFQRVSGQSDVVFRGYCRVTKVMFDKANVRGITITTTDV